jgi:hypothetical protein
MNRIAAIADPTAQLLAIAAARLALHRPEAGLAGMAPAALVAAEEALVETLSASDAPLARLARAARLSAFDLDLLGLALLPALDDRAAEAVETLARARRLTAGRAARLLLPEDHDAAALRHALRESPLWRSGLLRAADPAQPVAERRLDPTPALLAALDGALPERTAEGWIAQALPDPMGEPGSLAPVAEAIARWAMGTEPPLLLLDAARPERAAEALGFAAALRGGAAVLLHAPPGPHPAPPWSEAGVIAAATGALVALLAEGEVPGPAAPPLGPVAAIGAETIAGRLVPRRHLAVPAPRMAEQRARWRAARPDLAPAEADALAAQSWMAEADIAAIAAVAERPDTEALLAARMQVAPPRAAKLATLRHPEVPWDRLVLEAETAALLEQVVHRVRHRAMVRESWGMASGGAALVGLLTGEPGTGKTLAVEAMARRLGLPLLAADLSRVVSKYIGETEKNLAELFAAAEGFSALLFFDEADALFGKRTAVNDAHDRYANIEVNYLLQRLERFEGAVLLATNLAEGMDEAFARRFEVIVPFRKPGRAQRRALWQAHLPEPLRAPGLDLDALAASCEVTGGEIRNAALTAAYAAAARGERIGAGLLRAALAQEFAKAGRPLPQGLAGAAR